ncbi:hypothetical protein [Pseudochryseolinea flava]|uniref:Uncharacterized protein n=1 Tax=Pseudochryseolinea flava TaxID=2059302 RepID=A0A364Y9J0_9BACT|nr:hypothetical protein [Pseudochryseolinea flava]RAW02588.1 hypothetical protein DQQ10_00275 [Pseudochryseolinea flava]
MFVEGARGLEKWNIDFKRVACKNSVTGNSISPRIVKTGLHYIFIFVPREKGKYNLHGPISISQGKTKDDHAIGNEFMVE